LLELGLGLYFTAGVVYAMSMGLLAPLPFLCLFQVGFLYTALSSLLQQHPDSELVLRAQVAGD
jgi:hypothetical protein